jgi:hypothetical protein
MDIEKTFGNVHTNEKDINILFDIFYGKEKVQ